MNELVVEVDADDSAEMEMDDRADEASIKSATEFVSHSMLPSTLSFSRPSTGISVAERNDRGIALPTINSDPFSLEERGTTEAAVSLSRPGSRDSRPGSKEGRGGSIRATKVGVYESRPAFKELGFRTYGYRH